MEEGQIKYRRTHIAYVTYARFDADVPILYRRTYLLALAFAPIIAGIAGLFNYDAEVWFWSKEEGFWPLVLKKRPATEGE